VTLEWNAQDSAVVYFAETDPEDPSSAREPEPIPIEQVAEFVTEQTNPGNDKKVLQIEMGAAIPRLKSGLVLVDTPGVGSLNPGHTAATRAFLPNADAILFVASAVEPLGVAELNFLKLALTQCPIVITALTMIDKVVDAAPVVEEARARIAGVVGTVPAELVIVPVSSFRKRDALEEQDPRLLADSGFPELEAEIWGGLAVTCGAAQIHAALDAMNAALAEAHAPIANDLAAIRDWAKMDEKLRAEQEKHKRLMAESHGWRRDLQEEVYQAARPVQRQLDDDLDEIHDRLRKALGTDEALSNAPALVQEMSDAMIDAANRANHELENEMDRLADEYATVTKLSITVSLIAAPAFDPALPSGLALIASSSQAKTKPQGGYLRFREMWAAANAYAGAGKLLSHVLPGVRPSVGQMVGFVVGLFGGKRHSQRNAQEQQRQAYLADLRANVLPKLEAAHRRFSRDMADQIRDYGRILQRTLEDEITTKGDSLAASIRRLEKTKQRDNENMVDRQQDLMRQQKELTASRTELDELRARANGLTRDKSGRPGPSNGSPNR
jgi:hypothetical protein